MEYYALINFKMKFMQIKIMNKAQKIPIKFQVIAISNRKYKIKCKTNK